MSNNNTQLPAEVVERIDKEAKQFAFSNYVHAGINDDAIFEDVRTWPYAAQVSYFSIKNYLDSNSKCWLYKEPTIFTEYATKLQQAEQDIKEWKEECERLAKVAEYWQQEYYKLNPPRQPMKIDNNPIA